MNELGKCPMCKTNEKSMLLYAGARSLRPYIHACEMCSFAVSGRSPDESKAAWSRRADDAEVTKLVAVLEKHDAWHQRIGEVIFPGDKDENELNANITIDLSSEYADSSLYEETATALAPFRRRKE